MSRDMGTVSLTAFRAAPSPHHARRSALRAALRARWGHRRAVPTLRRKRPASALIVRPLGVSSLSRPGCRPARLLRRSAPYRDTSNRAPLRYALIAASRHGAGRAQAGTAPTIRARVLVPCWSTLPPAQRHYGRTCNRQRLSASLPAVGRCTSFLRVALPIS